MPPPVQLRTAGREIFDEALQAIDPERAIRERFRREGLQIRIDGTTIELGNRDAYVIAVGKAAGKMAIALTEIIKDKFAGGVISTNELRFAPPSGYQIFQGGHPEPNQESLASAQAAFALLDKANELGDLVIFLISGGGSAMIEWPISDEISLSDLRQTNHVLVTSGASIVEVNAVRRAFSSVKGGGLATRAPNCDQLTLIISDVPLGEESSVASGPTLTPPLNLPDALEVIERYHLREKLPLAIIRAIEAAHSHPEPAAPRLREHLVLLDNRDALEAAAMAAARYGFVTEIALEIADQAIDEGCALLSARLIELRRRNPAKGVCLISGGEFACAVKGDGLGGRNQETALRLVNKDRLSGLEFAMICAGTDGLDGNSPAAGAIVDQTTLNRAKSIGLDPQDFLDRNDSYSFFVALGDAINTGPTGTNVRDVRILLAMGS